MTDQIKRGPGRPRKDETEPAGEQISQRVQQTRTARRRRQDGDFSGAGRKLHVDPSLKDPNFEYRWLNDDAGRLHEKTVLDDWDFVADPAAQADPDMEASNADIGTRISRIVGKDTNGKPQMAYLVRKPKEFHAEDFQKAQAAITATVDDLKRGVVNDPRALTGDKAYVPKDGIKISD
jgi:hypothetical protein